MDDPVLPPHEAYQHRIRKRVRWISHVKGNYEDGLKVATALGQRPLTPDPRDPLLTKRQWDVAMRFWKADIKRFLPPRLADVPLTRLAVFSV